MKKREKKGMGQEVLGYWILGIVLMAILLVGYMILRGKGMGALEFIKNMFRFG